MRKTIVILWAALCGWSLLPTPLGAAEAKLPVIDGQQAVASVNGVPISLVEFKQAITVSHTQPSKKEGADPKPAGRIDFTTVLNRLINTRLLLLEARNMGLHELPEIKQMVADNARITLAEVLLEEYVKEIVADEQEVERRYKEAVREWKINAVKFKNETAAQEFETRVKASNDFDTAVREAIDAGLAQGDTDQGGYVREKALTGPVARLVAQMKVGEVSPVVKAGQGNFVLFKLEAMRYPDEEDRAARESAHLQVLNQQRIAAAKAYYDTLRRKRVKVNDALVDALDYESDPAAFEKLLADERVLAKVKKSEPVTVADLSAEFKKKFFHGIEAAIRDKRINKAKRTMLENMLEKRVLISEALRRKVDRSEAYRSKIRDYEDSLVFGAFIEKAVAPGIKLEQAELDAYYADHAAEYTTPKMVRLKRLAFDRRPAAQSALEKLLAGTDFNWLSAHAEGLLAPDTQGLLPLEGKLLTLNGLPADLQALLREAGSGDFRLYPAADGRFYVLYVYNAVAPETRPFEGVKNEIAKAVYQERLKKEVQLWADKLRAFYPVEIYLTDNL